MTPFAYAKPADIEQALGLAGPESLKAWILLRMRSRTGSKVRWWMQLLSFPLSYP